MDKDKFIKERIATGGTSGKSGEYRTTPVQSSTSSLEIKKPIPVGYLVLSQDKKTNAAVKIALYNKLPNKFRQLCIKWIFGWSIEKETEETI